MGNTLNKLRYIELLKKNKKISLYQVNETEYLELLSYGMVIHDQLTYNHREKYIQLMKKYLAREIDSFSLKLQFFEIQRNEREIVKSIEQNLEKLQSISINLESENFSLLITDIFNACEALKFNFESPETYGIDESDFRIFLENQLIQIENYLDLKKDSLNCQDDKVLKSVMAFFTVFTFLIYSVLNPGIFNILFGK